jgi:hypothetical protein
VLFKNSKSRALDLVIEEMITAIDSRLRRPAIQTVRLLEHVRRMKFKSDADRDVIAALLCPQVSMLAASLPSDNDIGKLLDSLELVL